MRLNLEMKKDVYERLRTAAETEGRSLSDVVRVLVNEWLELTEEKHRTRMTVLEVMPDYVMEDGDE